MEVVLLPGETFLHLECELELELESVFQRRQGIAPESYCLFSTFLVVSLYMKKMRRSLCNLPEFIYPVDKIMLQLFLFDFWKGKLLIGI